MNQSEPVFAKNAPIKKLMTKISRQTEFTMSRRLSAHNKRGTIINVKMERDKIMGIENDMLK